jgi:hypothetical protein
VTEVEYRSLRQSGATASAGGASSPEDLATELTDFLTASSRRPEGRRASAAAGSSARLDVRRTRCYLPAWQDSAGERFARGDGHRNADADRRAADRDGFSGILVRESPRSRRAPSSPEELVQIAGLAFAGIGQGSREPNPVRPAAEAAPPAAAPPESTPAETVLRQTDDLKKIVETVEREVIDRAMRRVEGNQSRAAQILNISKGSLIAKIKEFAIPTTDTSEGTGRRS